MKRKFISVVVAMLFVMILSSTAFAADTWKQTEDGTWYCTDKDGYNYYGVTKKSGNNYYYLDDATGAMVTNKLVEIDGAKYWFGADGAKVVDKWVQVPVENDDDGWEWMYFKPITGKAVTTSDDFVTINGKKYLFTSDGYMKYGYLDSAYDKATCVLDAKYYMGTKSEGSVYTGWLKFVDGEIGDYGPAYATASNYADKACVWFYFDGKNGKVAGTSKRIDGVKYDFNEDGSLCTGDATSTDSVFYDDNGVVKKNQWIKTSSLRTDETQYWYYLDKNGKVTVKPSNINNWSTECNSYMKKINGKVYLFDNTGKMLTGLRVVTFSDYKEYNNPAEETDYAVSDAFTRFKDLTENFVLASNQKIYYFSDDADNDGSMKTGPTAVTIDDETYTIYLDKRGVAYEGVVKGYIYNNGILQTGVGIVTLNTGSDKYPAGKYLVNASGKILTKAVVTDAEGDLYAVNETLGIAKFADQPYKGRAASVWKNYSVDNPVLTFTVGDTTYVVNPDVKVTDKGYKYIIYEEVK